MKKCGPSKLGVFRLRFQAQATSLGCGHVNAVDEEIVAVTVDHLQQLGKETKPQGNHHGINREMVELVDQGFERRLLKGKWNLCFIISRNSAEKKVEFCRSIRVQLDMGCLIKQIRSPMKVKWLEGKPGKAQKSDKGLKFCGKQCDKLRSS